MPQVREPVASNLAVAAAEAADPEDDATALVRPI
jgi:hypothetical protein